MKPLNFIELKVKDIIAAIEDIAPLSYQESYDNAGLIVGRYDWELTGALICLDVVEEVVEEAIEKGLNLIISHHPIVFKGLKRFNGNNYVERTVMLAIQNNIAIYSAHTNLDSVKGGVSDKMCDVLNLKNRKILEPVSDDLKKLVTYVPCDKAEVLRNSLFEAGAGHIGNYDSCSFNSSGEGTFKANEDASPYVGERGELHYEAETRIETVFPKHLQGKVINALHRAHPYEEVAYDIYSLDNKNCQVGLGMIGELETPMDTLAFLKKLKDVFHCGAIRYTPIVKDQVQKVALCGGSGSFLLSKAKAAKADIYITGDFKYHEFFDAEGKLIVADIGHYESEQFTREIFYEIVTKKFPNFAVRISEINSNPINYL